MARARIVKPEFFKHYELYQAEARTGLPLRLAFEGLWCQADRAGRFAWKVHELKLDVLPYDPVDFGEVLDALEASGFIRSYEVNGKRYGLIPTLGDHQSFHVKESPSKLPAPPWERPAPDEPGASTVPAPGDTGASTPGTGSDTASDTGSTSDDTHTGGTSAREGLVERRRFSPDESARIRLKFDEVAVLLPSEDHRDALKALCRASPNPYAWLCEVKAELDGMRGGGEAATPERVGDALWRLHVNGEKPDALVFRVYCAGGQPTAKRVRQRDSPAGSGGTATEVTTPIRRVK